MSYIHVEDHNVTVISRTTIKVLFLYFNIWANSTIYIKIASKRGSDGLTVATTFNCHWISLGSWVGTPTFFEKALWRAVSVVFSKHVTHYGPWSGFPYYDLTQPPPPSSRGHPSLQTGGGAQLWDWALRTFVCTQLRHEN